MPDPQTDMQLQMAQQLRLQLVDQHRLGDDQRFNFKFKEKAY